MSVVPRVTSTTLRNMKRISALLLSLVLVLPFTSCGTLMFQERDGAEHSGRIDPNVVIMDSLGLLVFIVPGLISFIVDYATGAIYLPPGVERGEGPFIE